MPLPEFTHLKYSGLNLRGYYHILYNLWDVTVEFQCPECGKIWQSPSMSYPLGDITDGLPTPFKCRGDDGCGHSALLIFDGLLDLVKHHYNEKRK